MKMAPKKSFQNQQLKQTGARYANTSVSIYQPRWRPLRRANYTPVKRAVKREWKDGNAIANKKNDSSHQQNKTQKTKKINESQPKTD